MVGKANVRRPPAFGMTTIAGDRMPVEEIEYRRTGGCFVSHSRCLTIAALIAIGFVGSAAVVFNATKYVYKSNTDSPARLLDFLGKPTIGNGIVPSSRTTHRDDDIIAKNYRLSVRPVFNATAGTTGRPFTIYGTVSITFTPRRDRQQAIAVRLSPGLQLNANNVFVYRSRIWGAESFAPNNAPVHGLRWIDSSGVENIAEPTATDASIAEPSTEQSTAMEVETETSDSGTNTPTTDLPPSETPVDVDDVNSRPARHFTEIAVTSIDAEHRADGRRIRIAIAVPLKRDHFYVLKVVYSTPMGATRCGFAASGGGSNGDGGGGYFGATLGGGSDAVPFPHVPSSSALLSPAEPVTFDLQVHRPIAMRSIATARLKTVDHIDPDSAIDVYHRSDAMPLAAFAFAVHELRTIGVQSSGTATKALVYVRPMLADRIAVAVQRIVPQVLQRFENDTGLVYDGDLHVILVPNVRSGFLKEAHSMMFLSEDYFIANSDPELAAKVSQLAASMFRTILRPLWADANDHWFTEAWPLFANPNAHRDLERRSVALRRQAYIAANSADVRQSQGISLLNSIAALIGPDMFAQSVRHFFKQKLAHTIDETFLQSVWNTVSDYGQLNRLGDIVELALAVDALPVLWIESNNTADVVKLTTCNGSRLHRKWLAPLHVLNTPNTSWLAIASQPTDHFRVQYSDDNWLALLHAIETGDRRLNANSRANMADDLFNLARCGLVSYALVYRLLRIWCTHETAYGPWRAVLDNLDDLLVATQATPSGQSQRIQQLIAAQILLPYRTIVLSPVRDSDTDANDDDHLNVHLTRMACATLQLTECRAAMQLAYDRLLAASANLTLPRRVLDLDAAYTVLCSNLGQDGGWSVWWTIRNALGNNHHDGVDVDTDFERMLVRSLACAVQPVMLRNFVGLLGNATMRPYRADIYAAAARNAIARWLVLEWLFEHSGGSRAPNYDGTNTGADAEAVLNFFHSLATPMEFEMLQRIFEVYPELHDIRSAPARWQSIVANIRANMAWRRRLDGEWIDNIEEAAVEEKQ